LATLSVVVDMRTKTLLISIVALLVLGGLFFALNSYIYKEKQGEVVVGKTVATVGTIVAVNKDQAAFDGPILITLQPKEGGPVMIAVPTMGLPLCPAYQAKNIVDVYLLKSGDEIKVRGIVGEDGSIVPCEAADHYLGSTPVVVDNFEGEADPTRMSLAMQPWTWISAQYNDGKKLVPAQAGKFKITFGSEGKFTATTDCNSMGGSYAVGANQTLQLSQMYATKMFCEGSQEVAFTQLLENTASYHFTSKGELIFDLKFDSGTVTFR
jgi:heat shock protein HslJ